MMLGSWFGLGILDWIWLGLGKLRCVIGHVLGYFGVSSGS
jgi:hypothetical protein